MVKKEFFTFRSYMNKQHDDLTASLEDYLEMIYRLSQGNDFTRIHLLAEALNVQPPSATKALKKLNKLGLVNYEKYGTIVLSVKGLEVGSQLLNRHNMIENFLHYLGLQENILGETEKIEHAITAQTLSHFANFIDFLEKNPTILSALQKHQQTEIPSNLIL